MDATELIQKAKKGNPTAFSEIYERYQPCIYRYAFYRLGTIERAERLTNDVFVYLTKNIDRLPLQDNQLLISLFRIAEELLADDKYLLPSYTSEEPPTKISLPDGSTRQHLAPQCLAQAMAHLPPEQYLVILSTLIEGLDRKEVARSLGKPLDTITDLQIQALASMAAITEHKLLAFKEAQQQGEIKRLLHEGIENLAHELRTPLNLIQGYAELLLNSTLGKLQPEQSEAIEIIYDRTQALAQLTHNLTTLRTIPPNALVITDISMTTWIDSVVKDFQSRASQVGIQVDVTLCGEPLPTVPGDRKYLDMALLQVLDNAAKFSPNKDTIRVKVWADQRYVYVATEDQGIGIAPEHLDQIFERFYQVDSSATRRFGGIGLGLSVVRAVVWAHGGFVQATSEGPDKGSTITIALPIKSAVSSSTTLPYFVQKAQLAPSLIQVLDDCLLASDKEQNTIEQHLNRHPEYADDLRSLVDFAAQIRHTPRPASSYLAFVTGKGRMLEALHECNQPKKTAQPFQSLAEQTSTLLKSLKTQLIPRTKLTLQPALITSLILVTFALGILFAFIWFNEVIYQKAVLTELNGVIEIISDGNQTGRIASIGHLIGVGDRIRTGPNTTATMMLFDGSLTTLGSQTELTIAQMHSRRDGSDKVIVLHQWLGQTLNRVEHSPDGTSHFRIETPTAMAIVYGTEFSVAVEENSTRVTVIKGIVEVTAKETTIKLKDGQETTATLYDQSLAIQPIATAHPSDVPSQPSTQSPQEKPTLPRTARIPPSPTASPTPTRQRPSNQKSRSTPTPALKPTERPRATNTIQPTNTPRPTSTPTPRPTPTQRPTPILPKATDAPSETNTPTSTPFIPTPTPTPTSTSTPTPTSRPTETAPPPNPTATLPPRLTPTPNATTTITPTNKTITTPTSLTSPTPISQSLPTVSPTENLGQQILLNRSSLTILPRFHTSRAHTVLI